jgi:hypothetical protein
MIPSPLPEPLPLLQGASMDTVMAALVAVPQELRQQPGLQVVMLRERRRLLLLESGALRQSFPVAIGMPGWETPTGRFKVLQKNRQTGVGASSVGRSRRRSEQRQSPWQPLDWVSP